MSVVPEVAGEILVVGDLILDEYLIGRATRLSREAAVPVLERSRRRLLPGGAANPAVGIAALGVRATLAGVSGDDPAADTLRALLAERGVGIDGVVVDPGRPTTTKTRIIAEGGFVAGQHLARIDVVDRTPPRPSVEDALVDRLGPLVARSEMVVVSDYRSGVVSERLLTALRDAATGTRLIVDSQGGLERFAGFDLVKCNRAEAERFLGATIPDGREGRRATLDRMREQTRATAVVVTLGGDGIIWRDPAAYGEARAPRAAVYDVTGAGDTVIAMLAVALAGHRSLAEACDLAARAAAITVRHMGNYAPTRRELGEPRVGTRG